MRSVKPISDIFRSYYGEFPKVGPTLTVSRKLDAESQTTEIICNTKIKLRERCLIFFPVDLEVLWSSPRYDPATNVRRQSASGNPNPNFNFCGYENKFRSRCVAYMVAGVENRRPALPNGVCAARTRLGIRGNRLREIAFCSSRFLGNELRPVPVPRPR